MGHSKANNHMSIEISLPHSITRKSATANLPLTVASRPLSNQQPSGADKDSEHVQWGRNSQHDSTLIDKTRIGPWDQLSRL